MTAQTAPEPAGTRHEVLAGMLADLASPAATAVSAALARAGQPDLTQERTR